MAEKILILGCGGHAESVCDSISRLGSYSIGLIAPEIPHSISIPSAHYAGNDSDLHRLWSEGYTQAFVAIGGAETISLREKLTDVIRDLGFIIPTIIDPSAIIGYNVKVGSGVFIGKHVVLNTNIVIGNNSIINTSCTIEHGCIIGDFSHIAPGTIVCGNVFVGSNVHVGAGSVIRQNVHVNDGSVIGMGSVVLSDIPSRVMAYGNPCHAMKEL